MMDSVEKLRSVNQDFAQLNANIKIPGKVTKDDLNKLEKKLKDLMNQLQSDPKASTIKSNQLEPIIATVKALQANRLSLEQSGGRPLLGILREFLQRLEDLRLGKKVAKVDYDQLG